MNIIEEIKYRFQRLVRSYGCSDRDLCSMDYTFAKAILPKLKAYKATQADKYPVAFMTWNQLKECGIFKTKQSFDKAVKNGDHIGGGAAKWEEALEDMIFAFEFVIADSPEQLEAMIRAKAAQGHSARMVAGYCWPWSKNLAENGQLVRDVRLGAFERAWNARPEMTRE